MSRSIPTECEHGAIVDWGDFGPTEDAAPEECADCERIYRLVERSSLGTPAAKAARDSVSDEVARRIVEQSKWYGKGRAEGRREGWERAHRQFCQYAEIGELGCPLDVNPYATKESA